MHDNLVFGIESYTTGVKPCGYDIMGGSNGHFIHANFKKEDWRSSSFFPLYKKLELSGSPT